jgi:hypothetical protein
LLPAAPDATATTSIKTAANHQRPKQGRIFFANQVPQFKDTIMSQIAIKFMASATLAHSLRQAALAKGTCVADIARRACENYIGTPKPTFGDALVESYQNDQGKKVVGALLSPPLASAIARIATETRSSQSHVLRGLIREALRARELIAATTGAVAEVAEPSPTAADTAA